MEILQEKHQIKHKPKPYRPGESESVIQFDFVAANTLEDSISRIGSLQDLRNIDPWSPKAVVHVEHINDDTYSFIVREKEPAPVELRGYLNRLDDTSTYVSGEASAKIYLQIGEILFMVALIVALTVFVGVFVMVIFAPPMGFFVWYYWRGARKERDRLVSVLQDTLSHR